MIIRPLHETASQRISRVCGLALEAEAAHRPWLVGAGLFILCAVPAVTGLVVGESMAEFCHAYAERVREMASAA